MTEADKQTPNTEKPPVDEKRRNLLKFAGWGAASVVTAGIARGMGIGGGQSSSEASTGVTPTAETPTATGTPTREQLAQQSTATADFPTATDIPETPTDMPDPTATQTNTPEATATQTPQPTATETEVPKATVVFDGNPNSEAGRAIGDGGFRSECEFGNTECSAWGRIVWGPFLRKKDHAAQGIKNNVTVRITVEGPKGHIKFGATDSGKYGDNMFGLGGVEADLADGPVTHEFFWEGINDDEPNNLTGYGFETIVQQLPGEKASVTNLKIEILN